MKDYVFLDLDGTLTDSEPGIYESLRVMLSHFGITKSDAELKPFLGPALWDSCPKYLGFNHEQTEEAIAVYREHYNKIGIYNNKVYPGIYDLLDTLKNNGKHLVLATGKPDLQAQIVCDHFNLTPYFEFLGGSTFDVSRSKKYQVIAYALEQLGLNDKDKEKIIMVGDRENDIDGAHKNGIKVCAVLYGYGNLHEFKEAGADYICNTVQDLKELLLSPDL